MQLDEALVGITALGFDTSPFIYLVERHPTYVDIVREVVRRVDTGAIMGYSSVVTLTEVLTLPKRLGIRRLSPRSRGCGIIRRISPQDP